MFFYTHGSVYPVIIRDAFLATDGNRCQYKPQILCGESVTTGGLHQILPFLTQGIQWKRRKECKSHRGWRAAGEHRPLTQLTRHIWPHRDGSIKHSTYMGLQQVISVYIRAISLEFYATHEYANERVFQSFACSWDSFSLIGLPCSTLM